MQRRSDVRSALDRLIANRVIPWVWLAIVAILILHLGIWWRTQAVRFDNELLALLPEEQIPMVVKQAQAHLITAAERRVIVLVGGSDLLAAVRAGDAYFETLLRKGPGVGKITYAMDGASQGRWRAFFAQYRYALLADTQRTLLRDDDGTIAIRRALHWYYAPVGLPDRLSPTEDPFQLFGQWQLERARTSRLRVLQNRLVATEGDQHYVALLCETAGSPFDQETQGRVLPALEEARAAAERAVPGVSVMAAGVVLHAAEGTDRAQREIWLIGLGSLAGMTLLTWLAFRSLYLLLLVQVPVLVGCLAALSLCTLVFDRLHTVTLVFGTSLLGVAVDYGVHYLCHTNRQDTFPQRIACLLSLAPGMWLAWLTTVLAYLALAIPPFPVLRQMAVFSVCGLLFAWLAVLLWLPRLTRGGLDREGRVEQVLARIHRRWPRIGGNRSTAVVAAVFVLIVSLGGGRVQVNDDVRLLQSSSPELLAEQRRVMRLTGIANPAQFLLVEAETPEAVLQAEEAVRTSLDMVRARGLIDGYQAVSQWVPSVARQQADATILDRRVYARGGWLERLAGRLGQPASWVEASRIARRAAFANTLRVEAWLDSPVSEPLRHHWLGRSEHGFASIILFQGIHGQEGVNALRGVAQHSAGAVWVDRVESTSALLGVFRREITVVLGVGYLLVLATLIARYGHAAWSVLAPTGMASLSALALFGWLGLTVNLFTVLALLLVLGMGIDYSIYLQEERRDPARAWLGVSLSAMSTLLSFGLLAFSRTPALEIFGFTMLCGVGLAWLLAPSFN